MDWTLILIGGGAAFAIQLLNLAELQNVPPDRRPDLGDPLYWIPFLVAPILGAFVCYLYLASEFTMKPILAAQTGASAPLILRAMASAIPRQLHSPATDGQ